MSKKCKFVKKNNEQCSAYAMQNSDYCFLHNPDISDDLKKQIQSKGGQGNKAQIAKPLPAVKIGKGKHVIDLLEDTINRVRGGELDIKIANCLGQLANVLLRAIEITNLENKVETVERIILERKNN